MTLFGQLLAGIEAVFKLLLLVYLFRGPFRKYLVFTIYILTAIILDPIELFVYYHSGWTSTIYFQLYWTDRMIQDLLLFLVLMSFTFQALRESPLRRKAPKLLGIIAAVALLLPFALIQNHHSKQYGALSSKWFNHASQIWNFGAALLNLVLWTVLVSNRRRDPKLVTLSIGLGILTSSAAIAWGARQWLTQAHRAPVDHFMTIAEIAALMLWCWVFRPKAERRPNGAPVPRSTRDESVTTTRF